jgi:hypothetical protein
MKTKTLLFLGILLIGTIAIVFSPPITGFATKDMMPGIVSVQTEPAAAIPGQEIYVSALARNADNVYLVTDKGRTEMKKNWCISDECKYSIHAPAAKPMRIVAVNRFGSMSAELDVV